jgi:hypothetical protein
MRRVAFLLVVAACAACAAGACGGTTAPGSATDAGSGAADGAGNGPDGGGSSGSPCPASAPVDGSACWPQGIVCEWGGAPVPACDTLASCNGGHWHVQTPGPGGLQCMAGGATCPASFAAVPRGRQCEPPGAYCDYPEGRCACAVPAGPVALDASASAQWICPAPAPGCPLPRAPLGSACSVESLYCDYDGCDIPGGDVQQCTMGLWTQVPTACPHGM